MNIQPEYKQGSVRVRIALIVLLAVVLGVCFYLQGIVSQILVNIQLMLVSNPQQALRITSRLLLWLVASTGVISVAVGFYLSVLSVRVSRSGVYPPPGMPVAFKTLVRRGAPAQKMRWICLVLGVLLFLQPLFGIALWYGMTGAVV